MEYTHKIVGIGPQDCFYTLHFAEKLLGKSCRIMNIQGDFDNLPGYQSANIYLEEGLEGEKDEFYAFYQVKLEKIEEETE